MVAPDVAACLKGTWKAPAGVVYGMVVSGGDTDDYQALLDADLYVSTATGEIRFTFADEGVLLVRFAQVRVDARNFGTDKDVTVLVDGEAKWDFKVTANDLTTDVLTRPDLAATSAGAELKLSDGVKQALLRIPASDSTVACTADQLVLTSGQRPVTLLRG